MTVAAETLGTKPGGPRIESAHLLGAAIGAKGNWDALTAAVDGVVYGYHSTHDNILKFVYRTAQAGETATGLVGFAPVSSKLQNVDVSNRVGTHFEYQENVHHLLRTRPSRSGPRLGDNLGWHENSPATGRRLASIRLSCRTALNQRRVCP